MPGPDFDRIRTELLRNGVAPRIALRHVDELRDHYEDLRAEALASGCSRAAASADAAERLGRDEVLVAGMSSRPELQSWSHRFPRAASLILPVAWLAVLPLVPVTAGIAHAASIARWLACLVLSALVTAAMMLIMQLSISLT